MRPETLAHGNETDFLPCYSGYGVSSKTTPHPAPDCHGQERSPPIIAVPYKFPFGSSTTCAGQRPPDCPLKSYRTSSLPRAFNLYTTPQHAVPPKRVAPWIAPLAFCVNCPGSFPSVLSNLTSAENAPALSILKTVPHPRGEKGRSQFPFS